MLARGWVCVGGGQLLSLQAIAVIIPEKKKSQLPSLSCLQIYGKMTSLYHKNGVICRPYACSKRIGLGG